MSFKKRETNQNKIRHPGRKRKIIPTIALSLSLLFGKTRLSSSQSSSPNFDNKVVQERIIDDHEFCSLEDNDQQVILVKTGDSAPSVPTLTGRGQPSNFPTPPAGGRPVYVPKYRTAPKPKVVPGVVQAPIPVEQAVEVEQLNLMINARLQKKSSKAKNQIKIRFSQTHIIQRKKEARG
jgi:hypothetical protein